MNQEEKWLLEEKHNGLESDAYKADLERLRAGEPLAYLIGHVPFLDCEIYLDSKPLIPRPETEYWVEKAIREIVKSQNDRHPMDKIQVLDLCAGSGCVGVAVAKAIPAAHVTFAEIDPAHLPTIEKNLIKNLSIVGKVSEDRFQIIPSDLFESVVGTYDFILSNPPYIDPVVDRAEVSVKAHEPHLALYGGVVGMELIEKIISEAPKYLSLSGQLWIEHEPEQVEAIKNRAEACGFRSIPYPDQYGLVRYSILKMHS